MGGADQFYVRLVRALNGVGHHAVALNRPGSPIARALSADPLEQFHLPLANQWDWLSAWRIRRWVKKRQPDIVQTYMGRATRLTRLPPTGRAVHVARLGGYYKIAGYYTHAHAWVGNTRGVCDYLVRSGLPAERVYQIGNFVPDSPALDLARLDDLRARLHLPEASCVIFTLGRFIDIKGFDDLLRAFAQLPIALRDRPLHLIIAGDGPLRDELHALARQLELERRVHWAGWQSDPAPYYQLADWVVCPSRHETLGNVILEAWSHGKPVLATTTPGASELIRDGDNGLLTPCNDPAALARRLGEAITAPSVESERLALAGRREVNEYHGREAVVGAYLDLYATLRRQRGH
ncbi:MAG: glycosyltransferase [Gammaproteobacteria bacterium]|nr:glycosyltransferase [Gammaproteobacteria bacterium]MCP5424019.1 glycosyltransferase [Gammaproteobacteria bacterium]MCP5459548.1 glycosyltransferase [Gammaproteobacteria bacterium]